MDEKKRLYGIKIHHIDAFALNKTVHAIVHYFSITEIYNGLLVFHQHFVKRFFILYYHFIIFFSDNHKNTSLPVALYFFIPARFQADTFVSAAVIRHTQCTSYRCPLAFVVSA